MHFKENISACIQEALAVLYPEIESGELLIEIPKDRSKGDYAFPCFQLAKPLRMAPVKIADSLHQQITKCALLGLKEVSKEGPYLNFTVDPSYLAKQLIPRIIEDNYLDQMPANGTKTMVEFSQPNTHKAFHVGHMRNVALGESLVHVLKWAGNDVIAANYIGDVGAHIAKCLWYFKTHYKGDIPETNRGEFLGELYTRATQLLDFKELTQAPVHQVVVAKITNIKPVTEKKVSVVEIHDGQNPTQVVCGAKGLQVGQLVAWAKPGSRVEGRLVQEKEVHGYSSNGMICSEKELGFSDDHEHALQLADGSILGLEIAELFKTDVVPASQSVIKIMSERTQGVQKILQDLEAKEPSITELWQETRQWSMEAFTEIYDWLWCHFDHYFYESDVGDEGKEMVKEFLDKGVLVRSEGAVGADLSETGLPFLLLLKSDGTGLYATKDLSLARRKFEDFGIHQSIYVVDASQSLHFEQVFKTLELMGFEQAKKCYHLAYGLVVLPDGKMSSRQGNIILFSELRAEITRKIIHNFLNQYRGDWPDSQIENAARTIAVATIKYGMLNQDPNKVIVFDLEEWTSKSGNTGPYLLYAYARTASVLREVGEVNWNQCNWDLLKQPQEKELLWALFQFRKMAARAAEELRPQYICHYLYQTAKDFARFWDSCSVLQAETHELKMTRAALTAAVNRTLKKGLSLLGIPTLEKM